MFDTPLDPAHVKASRLLVRQPNCLRDLGSHWSVWGKAGVEVGPGQSKDKEVL
ncbi:MAG: hypothetical protein IPM54_41580 [Polyangiaceae bacterium]|nr:hypothetical protein [Polyangiaceae bacterium]